MPSASAFVRYEPVCCRPEASSASSVRTSPAVPWSMVWLLAVVHAWYPTALAAAMICGGTLKDGYAENGPAGAATGVSWWQMARSLRPM
ncbi:hypothetical protein D9M70_634310 [compost metagenome]